MDGADGVLDRVVEKEDAAVSGKDGEGQAGHVGDEGVGGVVPLPLQALAGIFLRAAADGGLMDLLTEDGPLRGDPQYATEAAVVFCHGGGIVSPAGAEVQTIPGGEGDAAFAGGKAVGDAGEQRGGEPYQAVMFRGSKMP